jgi:hypothetical protein
MYAALSRFADFTAEYAVNSTGLSWSNGPEVSGKKDSQSKLAVASVVLQTFLQIFTALVGLYPLVVTCDKISPVTPS